MQLSELYEAEATAEARRTANRCRPAVGGWGGGRSVHPAAPSAHQQAVADALCNKSSIFMPPAVKATEVAGPHDRPPRSISKHISASRTHLPTPVMPKQARAGKRGDGGCHPGPSPTRRPAPAGLGSAEASQDRPRNARRLQHEMPRDHESLGKHQCDDCQARFARPSALATHTASTQSLPRPRLHSSGAPVTVAVW